MIPKKANSLYKEITEEFNVSENLVESLIEDYYKTLRKKNEWLNRSKNKCRRTWSFCA